MQKVIKTIYIPDLIPNLSLQSPFYKKICNDDDFVIFNWDFGTDVNNNYKIENYQNQLLTFINKFEDQEIRIIVDGFSSFIFYKIEKEITTKINFFYIINAFDKNLFLLTFDIKQKFLPNTIKLTIYKYIYLFNSLENFREDEQWIKAINDENRYFSQWNILHHKIFDQILNIKELNQYHKWISHLINSKIIIGDKNPLINIRLLTCKKNQITIIKNSGFCLHWENWNQLYKIFKED